MRLDKGFCSKSMAARMEALGVSYLLKVPRYAWLGGLRGSRETVSFDEERGRELRAASGKLWGSRLLSVERRRRIGSEEGELDLETILLRGHGPPIVTSPHPRERLRSREVGRDGASADAQ